MGIEVTLLMSVSNCFGILSGICAFDRFRVVFEMILGTKFMICWRHLLWPWLSLVICFMVVFCVCVVSVMRYISFPCLRAEKVVPRYLIGVLFCLGSAVVDVGRWVMLIPGLGDQMGCVVGVSCSLRCGRMFLVALLVW